ncbi:pantoate--beta-alanine ligase [PVC group bacterium (ex Bugula neritina AB1)]|nr:pantoate--beta-alanine ligase [PVC group bacterium (ex Bugula neritina AB1)]
MNIFTSNDEMQLYRSGLESSGQTLGFVPTMGALHEGHLSLVRASLEKADLTVVSLFVNPTQFDDPEDYNAYPRSIEKDKKLLEEMGVSVIFAPSVESMYPSGMETFVENVSLSNILCGEFRPGHFRGVCTVVLILLNSIRPQWIFLGEKDFQQLRIVENIVKDLKVNVEVVPCPTLREPSGLAMSSRNSRLDTEKRLLAADLYKILQNLRKILLEGNIGVNEARELAVQQLKKIEGLTIDYLEVVDRKTLKPVKNLSGKVIALAAIRLGKTRLIDNIKI